MEIWKDIKGFKGFYQISNFGRCKSFKNGNNKFKLKNEYIFKGSIINDYINYHLDGKSYKAHLLVWDHFGDKSRNGRKLQVDHIDNDKTNNRIDNLQLLNNRQNTSKSKSIKYKTSKYVGVFWEKSRNKWKSSIYINGKNITKRFDNEYEAHLDYQKKLKQI